MALTDVEKWVKGVGISESGGNLTSWTGQVSSTVMSVGAGTPTYASGIITTSGSAMLKSTATLAPASGPFLLVWRGSLDSLAGFGYFLTNQQGFSGGGRFYFEFGATAGGILAYGTTGGFVTAPLGATYSAGTIANFVATYDGTNTVECYINGTSQGVKTGIGAGNAGNNIQLNGVNGSSASGNQTTWQCFRFLTGTPSAQDITDLTAWANAGGVTSSGGGFGAMHRGKTRISTRLRSF